MGLPLIFSDKPIKGNISDDLFGEAEIVGPNVEAWDRAVEDFGHWPFDWGGFGLSSHILS